MLTQRSQKPQIAIHVRAMEKKMSEEENSSESDTDCRSSDEEIDTLSDSGLDDSRIFSKVSETSNSDPRQSGEDDSESSGSE